MLRLSSDAEHRQRLAQAAQKLAACDYSPEAFERDLNAIYDDILRRLEESGPPSLDFHADGWHNKALI
jgi:hypothetical protein